MERRDDLIFVVAGKDKSTVLRELRRMSDRSYLEGQEERDKLNKVNYKVDEILEKYYD